MQNQETYVTRTLYKIRDCSRIYADRIFRRIGEIREAEGFETAEQFHTVPEGPFGPMTAGSSWGGSGVSLWLRFSVTVPEEAAGQRLYLDPGTGAYETLCFVDGKPAGLLNSKNSYVTGRHSCLFLTENACPGDRYDIALECYAGHFVPGDSPYSNYGVDRDTEDHRHVFSGIALLVQDETVRDFYFDIQAVLQMALLLPEENYQRKTARDCLLRAFPDLIQYPADGYSDEEIRLSLEKVRDHLRSALEKGHAELSRGSVSLVGTSHIDTAWLWPMRETVRKCARTFAEVLSLMRRYPEYSFAQSSSLHTEWMRRYYPDLFQEMKERVAEGRYELVGGVWVESDCTLPGGEFLIRQFLYGQRYTEKWFGKDSSVFWLPDTFGYSGALPQIMRKCGIRTFYTTKMTWNDLNRWPFKTFLWKGIDGSAVPVHINEDNLFPDVKAVTEAMAALPDKSVSDEVLLGFGFGDGGGGPSEAMLESARRITGGLRGLPDIRLSSVGVFSEKLEAKADTLPVYEGELYLEYHRGTLTTMSETKRNNRKAENAVLEMERLNVLSGQPMLEDTEEIVKLLLQNQFHDILPGTGIREVNETCRSEVTRVISLATDHAEKLAAFLNEPSKEKTLRNLSPVPIEKDSVVILAGEHAPEGCVSQRYTDPMGRSMTDVFGMEIPSFGALVFSGGTPDSPESPFKEAETGLETPFYRAVFDTDGYLSSLVDKRTGREICEDPSQPLGAFYFGEDLPVDYDAWEIEWDSRLKQKMLRGALISRETVSDGPVEHRIRSLYRLSATSLLTVDTVFYSQNPRIDFHVRADWHERHRLLKAGFRVSVRAPRIKNEIQFGFVERPTTRNDPFENAMFEVSNHKWSDLSDANYGVALLNDSKYGLSAEGSDLRLTLLRAPIRPDESGDDGVHEMRYALLPHTGPFSAVSVVHPAYLFNTTPHLSKGRAKDPSPFVTSDNPGVLIETVKCAEDFKDAYVLRLYECERCRGDVTLSFRDVPARVSLCDMLEHPEKKLATENGRLTLRLKPFEILTLLVERKSKIT